MEKVTVTREEQGAIELAKTKGYSLKDALEVRESSTLTYRGRIIAKMNDKQIAYSYYNIAEIEPEPVNPWDALKAIYEGKTVEAYDQNGKRTILSYKEDKGDFDIFHPTYVGVTSTKFYIVEDKYE